MTLNYIYLDSVDSTNNWVKRHATDLPSGTWVRARTQTAGRGRFHRHWASPPDENLYATLYLSYPNYLLGVAQLMALSCMKILHRHRFEAQVKWPNDLLIGLQKVGGILTETILLKQKIGTVIGIGLNINTNPKELSQIAPNATSMAAHSGLQWNVDEVTQELIDQFTVDFSLFEQTGFPAFRSDLESYLAYKGQTICFFRHNERVEGLIEGISKEGHLILLLPEGEKIELHSGEISTRPQNSI